MYKSYSSMYFHNENTALEANHNSKAFFKVMTEPTLGLQIQERIRNGQLSLVVYQNALRIDEVKQYHKDHYGISKVVLLQQKNSKTFFVETYIDFQLKGFTVASFNEHFQEIETLRFDGNYRLNEYNESIYASEADELPIKEKLFYAGIWRIQEEDMD